MLGEEAHIDRLGVELSGHPPKLHSSQHSHGRLRTNLLRAVSSRLLAQGQNPWAWTSHASHSTLRHGAQQGEGDPAKSACLSPLLTGAVGKKGVGEARRGCPRPHPIQD